MHGLAISDAITSLLLHIIEPNKVDPERTKKDRGWDNPQPSCSIRLEMVTASRWEYASQSLWSVRDSIDAITVWRFLMQLRVSCCM
jgi:hypothetical protein